MFKGKYLVLNIEYLHTDAPQKMNLSGDDVGNIGARICNIK